MSCGRYILWRLKQIFGRKDRGIKYKLCVLYLAVTRFIISISQVNRIHLGTEVIYNGKKMYASNGQPYPKWTLREHRPKTEAEVNNYVYAGEDEFKKIRSWKNFKNDSISWFRWYVQSWLDIDAGAMANGETLSSVRILGKERALGRERRSKCQQS